MSERDRRDRVVENPPRLAHMPPGGEPVEALAAQLFRTLETPAPRLTGAARARVVARLDRGAPRRGRALWPVLTAAAVVLLVGSGVAASWDGGAPARRLLARVFHRAPAPRAASSASVAAERRMPRVEAIEPDDVDTAPAPAEQPAAVAAPRTRRTRAVAPARNEAAGPMLGPGDDDVVAESRLLAQALAELRQRHDPQRALAALDQYDQRFPDGLLGPEAAVARIDALLALGRRGPALQRLEAMSLSRIPRAPEMRVLRGELRAGRGDLAGAVADFDAVLAWNAAPDAVAERALYGRSSCRARLGDQTGARGDLQEYVRRFPHGRFATSARRALGD